MRLTSRRATGRHGTTPRHLRRPTGPAHASPGRPPTRGRRWLPYAVYATVAVLLALLVVLLVMLAVPPAFAQPDPTAPGAPTTAPDVETVLNNIRNWIMGILGVLATVFLTIGGVRYLMSAGEPSEVGKAKEAFKHAGFGYALTALAPLVVEILQEIVGV